MPRGGKRQGTPGKGYTNRTDLGVNYDMASGKAPAAGGLEPPSRDAVSQPVLPVYPEDTPNLLDPTVRPQEPITAGLAMGAGPGREALTNYDPRKMETQQLKRWLPLLEPLANDPETPASVRTLVQYIRGA